jgi:adenine C2-methylase RlmN of 23S rRNA A2503 and tRNA A37
VILKKINDTHEKAKHLLQQIEFFNKKLNLIFMDHGGRLDKSSNLKFLKNQIFAQHNVK